MSLFDYLQSQEIAKHDFPFYALIMTAMRQADTSNLQLLKKAFPDTWKELSERYNAPGGLLQGEEDYRVSSTKEEEE